MDLEDLALFRAVVQSGSITEAAARFGLSQSSASRHIQRLEQAVGGPLLERASWPLKPTPLGEKVFAFAGTAVDRWAQLKREAAATGELRGELTVVTSSAPSAGPVARWVTEFLKAHPRVRVHWASLGSRAAERAVAEGQAEVGFIGCPPSRRELSALAVAQDRIRLVVPPQPPYQHWPSAVPAAWLATVPLVARDADSATWAVVRQRLAEHGWRLNEPPAMVVDSAAAALAAVAAGAGVSFVSEAAVRSHRAHQVRALDVAGVALARALYVVYEPSLVARRPLAGALVDFVAARAQGEGRGGRGRQAPPLSADGASGKA